MNLNKLPPNILSEVVKLSEDEQFQKKFSEDELLDKLEAQKHNKDIELNQLLLLLNRKTLICGVAYKPITMALYSYLYCLQSHIVTDMDKITKEDLDLFFYLLQTKNFTNNMKELLVNCVNYCQKELNLNYNQTIFIFNRLYAIQFKVLSYFPRIANTGSTPIFNVDWMLNIISKVKPYTSYSTHQLYTEVPVMEIYYYFAAFLRNNGENSIFVRNDEEILDEMDSRMIEMVIERLVEKKVIDQSDHQKYFDLMKQKQKRENE